jgi:prephenate dehydrogenase
MITRIAIIGTGLIGASIGLALRRAGFTGHITGIDTSPQEADEAHRLGAVDHAITTTPAGLTACRNADLIILAVPVLAIMQWVERLAPILAANQLVTDTGSTKATICELAARAFSGVGRARFLPGHPMAGKESGGAALAEATLFDGATWLFTPLDQTADPLETEWHQWVERFGARTLSLDPARHDRICAWVSHLPQMVSTAMAAMFADEFAQEPHMADDFAHIGGRALREMTRLGASPYSMWRDVALTNTANLEATLFALEQRLTHIRENLKTPELREEFTRANRFRANHK